MSKTKGRRIALTSATALLLLIPVVLWSTWADILFLIDFETLGKNEQGYREYRHRQTGIIFVSLPGGTFLMGSPEGERGHRENEGPVHEVTLSPFMIGKYEVTQGQWEEVMGLFGFTNPGENNPAETTWDDVQDFESATGLGLLTEAQWEYACRAGTQAPFAYGSTLDSQTEANYNGTVAFDDLFSYPVGDTFLQQTVPVGSYAPNRFGLHDMHGNVFEWCEDVYKSDFYLDGDPGLDPISTTGSEIRIGWGILSKTSSEIRVSRGGCWGSDARDCRSAYRGSNPWSRMSVCGFRPAVPTP